MRSSRERKRNPTIEDIAKRAGVAPMTVSRVINANGYVSEGLRMRVQQAIADLDYSPNWLARSLKKSATHVVGVVLPDIGNPYAAELAHGIQRTLNTEGYSTFLVTVDPSGTNESSVLRALFDHRVDGMIVATRTAVKGNDPLQRIADRKLPMVVIGRGFVHPLVDRVSTNARAGAYEVVRHLKELGHMRIGFIGGSPDTTMDLPRFTGYLEAMRECGLPVEESLMTPPIAGAKALFTTQDDGYAGMKQLMNLQHRPTAVFARNDYTAIGALLAAREAGVSVPLDVSLVGFDNVPLSSFTAPPLTTVDQPTEKQGEEAARLLLSRMRAAGAHAEATETMFDCHLVVRESSAPAIAHTRRVRVAG